MVSVLAAQRVRAIKTEGGRKNLENQYAIEMLNITKKFPGIIANDNITLQLKKGEIHALLGENGAGKSTLMSVLFGLYQPEEGIIKKDGKVVSIKDPNDATALGIGMVHQHFKLVDVFTVLDNIILGAEDTKLGFLEKKTARKKVQELSDRYGLKIDLDAKIEDITVGMQQRVEILKMLYRDNEILIFDEPTAVLTPQEIEELMATMKEFAREGKSILFISHKLNEIMEVADRCSVLRKAEAFAAAEPDYSVITDDEAQDVLMLISHFPQVVRKAMEQSEPSMITRHTTQMAQAYNKYYFEHRIMDESDPAGTAARVNLTRAVRDVIKTGLYLIGVEAPERM